VAPAQTIPSRNRLRAVPGTALGGRCHLRRAHAVIPTEADRPSGGTCEKESRFPIDPSARSHRSLRRDDMEGRSSLGRYDTLPASPPGHSERGAAAAPSRRIPTGKARACREGIFRLGRRTASLKMTGDSFPVGDLRSSA
jgi:hypothetical protein